MVKPVSFKGFQKGFQGVSLRGFRGFQIFLWELCVCIKYLSLGEKTLLTLIQTNETKKSTQTGVFHKTVLARNSEKASACRIGQY